MINRLLFLFLFLGISHSIAAQFEFGLKAGLATEALQGQSLKISGEGVNDLSLALKEADYGIQAGIFLRIPLGEKLFLQPEFTFNTTEANFELDNPEQNETFIFSERYNNVDIPFLVGYKLGFLKLHAGPVGHLYFDKGGDVITQEGWSEAFDNFNLGYALGGAIDISRLTIDLRYDGNFSKFGQTFSFAGNDFAVDEAPKRWIATIGYRF